jgi:hypothetical protein
MAAERRKHSPARTRRGYTNTGRFSLRQRARFRVVVSNSFGYCDFQRCDVNRRIQQAPKAKITRPRGANTRGDTIALSGSGTDKEDGTLPSSAFTWSVVFHHDTHTHPFISDVSGVKSSTFTIPTRGETATNVWYRIYLTVRDSSGATDTDYIDIKPRTVRLRIRTSPGGGQISLDGVPATGLISVNTVAGIVREVGALTPQTINGVAYVFDSWSDGGAATHEIAPTRDLTLTANFRPATP